MNDHKQSKVLSFEWDKENEVLEIHCNAEGLRQLNEKISSLIKANQNNHAHLMTSEWGGEELTSEKNNPNAELINHVKIFNWK